MTLSETHIETDPLKIFDLVESLATALRRKLNHESMRGHIIPQDNIAVSEPFWVTYKALSHCQHSNAFMALEDYYKAQRLQLGWITGFNLRTPGKILSKLPLENDIILPPDKLREMRAVITLGIIH